MKCGVKQIICLLLIAAVITAGSLLYVGVKHGKGNRALLTMRSGLIKIRRGLYEFGWGLRDYAIVGINSYRKKTDIRGEEELQDLEWEQQELERDRQEQLELKELEKERAREAASEQALEPEVIQESEPSVEEIAEESSSPQQAENKEGEGL